MTRTELAEQMGVTITTIFNWQRQGLPKEKKELEGKAWRWDFDLQKCLEWLESQKGK